MFCYSSLELIETVACGYLLSFVDCYWEFLRGAFSV